VQAASGSLFGFFGFFGGESAIRHYIGRLLIVVRRGLLWLGSLCVFGFRSHG
jgi:hypothetical protein